MDLTLVLDALPQMGVALDDLTAVLAQSLDQDAVARLADIVGAPEDNAHRAARFPDGRPGHGIKALPHRTRRFCPQGERV